MGGSTSGPHDGVQPRTRGPDATGPGSHGGSTYIMPYGMRRPTKRAAGTVYAWNKVGDWPLAGAPGAQHLPPGAVVHADVWVYNHPDDPELVEVCVGRTYCIGCVRERPAGWAAYGAFAFVMGKHGMDAQHYPTQQAAVGALVAAWTVRLMDVLRAKKKEMQNNGRIEHTGDDDGGDDGDDGDGAGTGTTC